MFSYGKYLLALSFIFAFLSYMPPAPARGVFGEGIPATCEGSVGWSAFGDHCQWDSYAQGDGLNWIKNETRLTSDPSYGLFTGYSESFVPYDGQWRIRTYICHVSSASRCDAAQAVAYFDGSKAAQLSASQSIGNQSPDFGSTTGTIPANSSLCYAFADATRLGRVYTTAAARSCTGLPLLPDAPSVCHLNADDDLNVVLGTLERSEIDTDVVDSNTVNKEMTVACQGNAEITTKMQFQYTPDAINGQQL